VTSSDEFLEALSVLVTLLEQSRQDLRGHSAAVARLTRKTCERIGVGRPLIAAFVAAAYLHDLGKMGAYHLTALNVAEYDGHRVAALKSYEMPAQLMASVGLSADTLGAVTAMYERYDGQGFPEGLRGKDIPLGARILALADTYADLTHNPRNPYRKMLGPAEAMDALGRFRGTIFDPNVVDVFGATLRGDPAAPDPLSAKLRELTDKRSSRGTGVSGSLAQMSLPAMVQVLWHGRKTCALKIEAQDRVGEIHFADGQVYNAQWGNLRGEDAFYEMLALHEGAFRLDATFRPSVRAITASPEALLLEGMRRLDESGQPRA
jgi:hypothetical protein